MQSRNTKILLTTITLLIVAGWASAFVCHDTDVSFDGEVIREVTDVSVNYPLNNTETNSPVEFSFDTETCWIYSSGLYTLGMGYTVDLYDSTETIQYTNVTYESTLLYNTTFIVSLDPAYDDYNWTVKVKYAHATGIPSPSTHTYNWTFFRLTTQANADEGTDTGGACLTPFGYRYNYTAGVSDEHVVFTLPSDYCVNVKCENAQIVGGGYYHYGDYQIVANTTLQKAVNVYIGGWNYNFSVDTRVPTADQTVDISSISDFTYNNPNYWLLYKNETDNTNLILDGMTSLDLKVFCQEYSPDTLNIQTLGHQSLFLTVKEQPAFEHIMDSQFNRVFQSYQNSENITIYLPMNTTPYESIEYQLQDYTGQFYDSYLQVITNVNGTLATLYQRKWYNTLIEDVDLVNETDYQYVLYTPTVTRIIRWDYIDESGERIITVTDPTYVENPNYIAGVLVGFSSSYSGSSVGLIYNVTDGGATNITFKVYNTTASNYQLYDAVSIVNPVEGTITVTVPNQNETYFVSLEVQHNTYGLLKAGEYIMPAVNEARFPMYGSWGLPDKMLGVSKDSWYTGGAIFLITLAAFMIPGGQGAILTVGVIGVTKWMGWFREMTWGLWGFITIMAIIYALVEKRRKLQ